MHENRVFFLQKEGNDNLVAMNDNVSFFFSNSLLKIIIFKRVDSPLFFSLELCCVKGAGNSYIPVLFQYSNLKSVASSKL